MERAIVWLVLVCAGCATEQSIGTNKIEDGGPAIAALGEACSPSLRDCEAETFCETAGGLCFDGAFTGNCRCQPLRELGEPCTDARECREPDARCLAAAGEMGTCHAPAVGDERCEDDLDCTDGRLCTRSYCLLRPGQPCEGNEDCASNRCFSSSGLDYRCQ